MVFLFNKKPLILSAHSYIIPINAIYYV